MPDEMDIAQDLAEEFRTNALMMHGINHTQRKSLKTAPTHCESCGEEIPKARRRAMLGCCLCTDCQAEAEQERR